MCQGGGPELLFGAAITIALLAALPFPFWAAGRVTHLAQFLVVILTPVAALVLCLVYAAVVRAVGVSRESCTADPAGPVLSVGALAIGTLCAIAPYRMTERLRAGGGLS